MKTLSITEAKKKMNKLIQQVNKTHEPIKITSKHNNAVLVSEEDWRDIQETIYLTSIPGIRESIIKDMKKPLTDTCGDLKW